MSKRISEPPRDSMKFQVGPFIYTLVISSRDIYDEDGDYNEAHFYEDRRLIILSPRVEPRRRAEVLKHEIQHCWETHVGNPNSEEGRCQLFATISEAFDSDLERQGGREALERLTPRTVNHLGKPSPTPAPRRARHETERPAPDKIACGRCEAYTACGSIEHGEVEPHAAGGFRVQRWFICNQCGALQVWHQFCLPAGELLPQWVSIPKPRLLTGEAAALWLDEHPAEDQPPRIAEETFSRPTMKDDEDDKEKITTPGYKQALAARGNTDRHVKDTTHRPGPRD